MDHIDEIELEELHEALEAVDEKKPTQRLLAAIAYKHGVTQTELAEWHGVQRKTIFSWLKRLESRPLAEAVTDDPRPGRPGKLSADQRAQFERTVTQPPAKAGYEARTWSPELVQRHLEDAYDVAYSIPSCRRLLKEAGLEYRPRTSSEASGGGWVSK
jgi:transposase